MPNKDHFVYTDFLPYRFQIGHGAVDCVIPQMWQKAGETASRLIIKKDFKSIGCKAAVDVLIKGTLSHSGPAVQIDDGFGLHRDSLWRIELAVGN